MPISFRLSSSRKWFLVLLLSLTVSISFTQSILQENKLLGIWSAKLDKSQLKSGDALFLGSTVTFNSDHTFTAKILDELSGTWKLEEGQIILDTRENIPSPIIFTELTDHSFVWRMDKLRVVIPFEKAETASIPTISETTHEYVLSNMTDLAGNWINTRIEDISLSERQNASLFGRSAGNDPLCLGSDGHFSLFREKIEMCDNDSICYAKGVWSVTEGVVTLEWESGKIEHLGIEKKTADSLVLIDLNKRNVIFRGNSKLRFVYTKETAISFREYLIKPAVMDTFYSNTIGVVLKVPETEFPSYGNNYFIKSYPVLSIDLEHCPLYSSKEEKMRSIKEDILLDPMFVQILETKNADYILYLQQSLASARAEYIMIHLFSYNNEIYCIQAKSFLKENLDIIHESVDNMEITMK